VRNWTVTQKRGEPQLSSFARPKPKGNYFGSGTGPSQPGVAISFGSGTGPSHVDATLIFGSGTGPSKLDAVINFGSGTGPSKLDAAINLGSGTGPSLSIDAFEGRASATNATAVNQAQLLVLICISPQCWNDPNRRERIFLAVFGPVAWLLLG